MPIRLKNTTKFHCAENIDRKTITDDNYVAEEISRMETSFIIRKW